MPDHATFTTQSPGQPPFTRPVPPSWATVAPLLARWQMALMPHWDGTWSVLSGYVRHPAPGSRPGQAVPQLTVHSLPFHALPQAIADVAARCEAGAAVQEACDAAPHP